jgi:hypothetical protein
MRPAADLLIMRLAYNELAAATPADADIIAKHMGQSSFSPDRHRADEWASLGTDIVGQPHPGAPGEIIKADTMLDSLEVHAAKRAKEEEWEPRVTSAQYLADAQASARDPAAEVYVGVHARPPRRAMSGTLTRQRAPGDPAQGVVFDPTRLTLFVAYDAERGHLTSCYLVDEERKQHLFRHWRPRRRLR